MTVCLESFEQKFTSKRMTFGNSQSFSVYKAAGGLFSLYLCCKHDLQIDMQEKAILICFLKGFYFHLEAPKESIDGEKYGLEEKHFPSSNSLEIK